MGNRRVKVSYYGLIRNVVGKKEDEVELAQEDATVGKLVEVLATNYGERLRKQLIGRGGAVHPNVKVFVADKDIGQGDGLNTRLDGEDKVTFVVTVSQMSGG